MARHPRFNQSSDQDFQITGRVTVEHRVLNPEPLCRIQAQLGQQLTSFRPHNPDDLHFTLFHFGIPAILYGEIKAINSNLAQKDFWPPFLQLLTACQTLVKHSFELGTAGLSLLGHPRQPVIALEIEAPNWLLAKRAEAGQYWTDFLRSCGVSQRLKANKPFRPHVSLGRLDLPQALPNLDIVVEFIKLSPTRLRNVTVS